ncbi:MAG: hypothetical protein KA777_01295 [Rhodoferax sp.]|nr:hypothetical protein [Rhodoferax sp.]
MPKPYTPPRDSLAALVCGYFQNNPDEELGLDDIVEKFSLKSHARVHSDLGDAWRAGLLSRDVRDGDVIYTAGNLEFTTAKALPTKPARKNASNKIAKPAGTAPTAPVAIGYPDPLTVPLEDGVPYSGRASRVDWTPLLTRMQPNQSAKLPLHCKSTLAKAVMAHHKQGAMRFTIKCNQAANELRVWRVA